MASVRNASGVPTTYRGFAWSKIIDALVGSAVAQGDILYRNATSWVRLAASTAGYVLSTGGAGANPSWISVAAAAGGTYGIYKTSDESRASDTTLTDDSTLVATLLANKKYRLEFDIWFDATPTPDFKYDFNFTGTVTSVLTKRFHGIVTTASISSGTLTSSFSERADSALNNVTTFTISGTDTVMMSIIVQIEVGASGGTFSFRWAQNTSNATACTVRRNSSLLVTEIA